MRTTLLLTVEHSRPLPFIDTIAESRVYTVDGVDNVSACVLPAGWEVHTPKPPREGFWAKVWSRR